MDYTGSDFAPVSAEEVADFRRRHGITRPYFMTSGSRADYKNAALFFSAETARQSIRLLRRARLHEAVRTVDALAIGRSAAVALEALPWRRIRVAERPDQEAMLALLQ